MARNQRLQMPTARQLPSGNWTVQLRIDGQSICVTKPTEREAIAEAIAIKEGIIKNKRTPMSDKTLRQAVDLWIAANDARLSPATVRGYIAIRDNGFPTLMGMRCGGITAKVVERAINTECKHYKAKTVVNRWRFLSQVIEWATGERLTPNLPQVVAKETEFLDMEDLTTYLDHIKGKKAEIPALLAISSLRRSEIAALDWSNVDLKNRWIHVRGAVVPDRDHQLTRKETNKNSSSRRDVPIIEPLYQALQAVPNKTGPVVRVHPATMLAQINRACRDAGVPEVGCHGLRHSFASLCHILNIPPAVAMQIGGWSDRATMDRIYTHVSKRTRDSYANAFTEFFTK